MPYQCTEQRFLEDIKSHNMAVQLDDGVHRHLTFSRTGSSTYRFDLLTWPDHLTITGDCGTYTFERVPDMFEFFRPEPNYKLRHPEGLLFINPGYWGQKLNSICKEGGYREYSAEVFTARVKDHFDYYCATGWDASSKEDMWHAIEEHVLSKADSRTGAYAAISDFKYGDFEFVDFFDGSGTEDYSYHYMWCLYAIVSGITTYDAYKKRKT